MYIFRKATKLALDRLAELSVKIDKENIEVCKYLTKFGLLYLGETRRQMLYMF
jgi:hypothetical protein